MKERQRDFPPSFSQRRFWFLEQWNGGAAYNVPVAFRIRGGCSEATLRAALDVVVGRHEILRQCFPTHQGSPYVQMQHAQSPIEMRVETTDEDHLPGRLGETSIEPFNLETGPLLRAVLFRLGESDNCLLLVVHHIACDGWSLVNFAAELSAAYGHLLATRDDSLGPLHCQFEDYAKWQRERLTAERQEELLRFWCEQIASYPFELKLPSQFGRPERRTGKGGAVEVRIDAATTSRLRQLSRTWLNGGLFSTLLGAYAALLARFAGQERLLIGCPVANRTKVEFEPLIGPCLNTLIFPADLSANPSFVELATRLQEFAYRAYEHQDLPVEVLVENLRPERDLRATPVFQTTFVYLTELPTLEVAGAKCELVSVPTRAAKFDLAAIVFDEGAELRVVFEFASEVFEEKFIDHLARHYSRTLSCLIEQPHDAALALVRPDERDVEVYARLHGDGEEREDPTVPEAIARRAALTPNHVAVRDVNGALTYRELDARSAGLSRQVMEMGIGRGDRVAICLQRSVDLIVATVAVMKSGAAFVPLDPALPPGRLDALLREAQPSVLITSSAMMDSLPATRLHTILCDTEWGTEEATAHGQDDGGLRAGDVAYVMFTSGSGGMPKGVEVRHGSLANLTHWHIQTYGLTQADNVTQLASPGFDAFVWEIMPALASGAAVLVAPDEVRVAPEALGRWLAENGVTVTFIPTPLLEEFFKYPWTECGVVRTILTGGAALRRRPPQTFPVVVVNHYGPTECTVVATCGTVDTCGGELPHIGRPIAGTKVCILDGELNPVPVGAIGELFIGGRGVALGYLNDPVKTAERFLTLGTSKERWYRTGDRVRLTIDGNLEFIGRTDNQVKIRGHRIELAEIEARILECSGVDECGVILNTARSGDELEAYVSGTANPADIAEHLRRYLPDAAVPSRVMLVDALPRLPSGKLDAKALRPVDIDSRRSEGALSDPLEAHLARVWENILGHSQFAAEDSFFDVGGHSLHVNRLVGDVHSELGVELSIRDVFELRNIRSLGVRIRQLGTARPALVAARVEPMPHPERTLSAFQERVWFLERLGVKPGTYHIPFAIDIGGPLDVSSLHRSLQVVAARHEMLRTRYVHDGQLRGIVAEGELDWQLVELSGEGPTEERLTEEACRALRLDEDPLFRAVLFRAERAHTLLLVAHHIILDGVSLQIVLDEMGECYRALRAGLNPSMAPPAERYERFAAEQRSRIEAHAYNRELAYWQRVLAGAPRSAPLPADFSRPSRQTFNGARVRIRLSNETARGITQLARQTRGTPYTVLLAGTALVLGRWMGVDDVVVGAAVSERQGERFARIVGPFVNMLPLRVTWDHQTTFRELVERTVAVVVDAQDNRAVPFERIIEAVGAPRDLGASPLFSVAVLYEELAMKVELDGATTAVRDVPTHTSKFDLSLMWVRSGQDFHASIEFAADIYAPESMEKLAQDLERAMARLVAAPNDVAPRRVRASASERELLDAWNRTNVDYSYRSLPELFEAAAERHSDHVAIVVGMQKVSYRQLRRRVHDIAQCIRASGIRNGEPVGVFMQRSAELVATILGIMLAGGAFVPMAVDTPRRRLQQMISRLTMQRAIADKAHARVLDGLVERVLVAQDAGGGPPCEVPGLTQDAAAYVLHTSGSTGEPKGAINTHGGLTNRLLWMQATFRIGPGDRVLQKTPYTFDVSVWELLWPLIAGATLVLPPADTHRDPRELYRMIEAQGITVCHFVPTALREFLNEVYGPLPLRVVICSGEALTLPIQSKFFETCSAELHNLYGPTECAIDVTHWQCHGREQRRTIPIGKPIANTQTYVLDDERQRVPIGHVGELYLGGQQVGNGYAGLPDATARQFVPDPFRGNGQLYRTGDLARYRLDGNLEFLGRRDAQIKFHGLRIELEDIESQLDQHPAVGGSAACIQQDQLIAFYALQDHGAPPTEDELRGFLAERLPPHMVPNRFSRLESLPRTSSGKLDRRALSELSPAARAEPTPVMGGMSTTEQRIVDVWKAVLGHSDVGRHSVFFEVGGNSVLLVRVQRELEGAFNTRVPLVELYRHSRPSALASYMDGEAAGRTIAPVPPRPRTAATMRRLRGRS